MGRDHLQLPHATFRGPGGFPIFQESGSDAPFIVVSGEVGEGRRDDAGRCARFPHEGQPHAPVRDGGAGLEEAEERRRVEENLRRRDAILRAVAFAAERFLGEASSWKRA